MTYNDSIVQLKTKFFDEGLKKISVRSKKYDRNTDLNSVTRWLHYFYNVLIFKTLKNCYFGKMFAQAGWKICQILNKPYNYCQRV